MRKRNLRAVSGTVVALSAALTLVGCTAGGERQSQSGTASGSSTTTTVWYPESDEADRIRWSVDVFNESSTVGRLEFQKTVFDGYEEKLRTGMGANTRPGIFMNWGGGGLFSYVESDLVVPLEDVFEGNSDYREAFMPAILDVASTGGKDYGIPNGGTQPVVMFYNKAVFEEANIQPPTTMDELYAAIDVFNEKGITPIALPGTENWCLLMWVEYLVDRIGGPEIFEEMNSGDWDAAWADPAVLEMAKTVQDLVDRGAFGPSFASTGYGSGGASTLLSQGQAAMLLMGTWEYGTQLADSPEFATDGLGWFEFPAVEGGKGDPKNLVGNPSTYFSVSTSADIQTAAAYLETMWGATYVEELINNGAVPVTTGARDLLADAPNPEFATWQYDAVTDAPTFTQSWDQALTRDLATPLLTEIQSLFLKQTTPEEFVKRVQDIK